MNSKREVSQIIRRLGVMCVLFCPILKKTGMYQQILV
jgi:hypothetical protein